MTLISDWEVWQYAARKSPYTVKERVRVVRLFADEIGFDPQRAQPVDIVRWLAGHDEWSDGTAATYTAYLSAWFKWLQLQEHRVDNPMIKVGSPRYPDREPRPVSDVDLVTLISSRMHSRTRAMILLAALGGLRVHEIAKVRGEDVEQDGTVLRVTGKGRKTRTIPLHRILQVSVVPEMPARGYWFPSGGHADSSGHILAKSVSDIIGRAMRRAGVRGTPHCLRHWYASTLLDDGADLRTVQELMRHKSVASTQVYTQVTDHRRREAIGRLDPFRARRQERHSDVAEIWGMGA